MKEKFCPKCKSMNFNIKITPSAVVGVPQKWACMDCGYNSYAYLEKNEENLK